MSPKHVASRSFGKDSIATILHNNCISSTTYRGFAALFCENRASKNALTEKCSFRGNRIR